MATGARNSMTEALRVLAHEALARGAHERHGLGKEHAHRVTKGDRLLVGAALDVDLPEPRPGQLDRRVQRQRRELLPLRLLHRLSLLLGELAQAAHQLLGVAAERESESTFHARHLSWPGPACRVSRRRLRPVTSSTRPASMPSASTTGASGARARARPPPPPAG